MSEQKNIKNYQYEMLSYKIKELYFSLLNLFDLKSQWFQKTSQ